jgi:hypothetical protein
MYPRSVKWKEVVGKTKTFKRELVAPDGEEEASISLVSCTIKWYGREVK